MAAARRCPSSPPLTRCPAAARLPPAVRHRWTSRSAGSAGGALAARRRSAAGAGPGGAVGWSRCWAGSSRTPSSPRAGSGARSAGPGRPAEPSTASPAWGAGGGGGRRVGPAGRPGYGGGGLGLGPPRRVCAVPAVVSQRGGRRGRRANSQQVPGGLGLPAAGVRGISRALAGPGPSLGPGRWKLWGYKVGWGGDG